MTSLSDKIQQLDATRIPRHVAVIMDGNGRWAKEHGQARSFGHENGVTTVRQITEIASEVGVKYLTLYTFSTENWNRPQAEVDMLMHLVVTAIEQQTPDLIANNVRLTTIGDLARMPQFARERLERCMADTSHCTGLVLCLALSYSARWEIVEACRNIARQAQDGSIAPGDIDEQLFARHLATADMPDPDLLIRTGGEQRISNYLLWQIAYAELYFCDTYWPDFSDADLHKAIADYQSRQRRYGKTGEQIMEAQHNEDKHNQQ